MKQLVKEFWDDDIFNNEYTRRRVCIGIQRFHAAIIDAGGHLNSFNLSDLDKMTGAELLKILTSNHIRFQFIAHRTKRKRDDFIILCKNHWNEQADEYNQWDALDCDEKLEWIGKIYSREIQGEMENG